MLCQDLREVYRAAECCSPTACTLLAQGLTPPPMSWGDPEMRSLILLPLGLPRSLRCCSGRCLDFSCPSIEWSSQGFPPTAIPQGC